ncbi:MAG: hypothetical protein CMI53_01965 [Parcubacteria group bacterium]|nr:hypothetical protein [Parcubacteria group bacterium]|tara:strand:- start:20 stop:943 length:924 start_codon:yes stop_codon:yes gene_type:complete
MTKYPKKIYLMIASNPQGIDEKKLLSSMPELGIIANVEPVFIFKNQAADVTPPVWLKLAKEIYQRKDKASGFVILHGLDNLLYTSSALSFLLQNISKPIIFTGVLLDQQKKQFDIKANLINAAQATRYNLNEVCLMFGNRLLRANQASRASEQSLNIFTTPQSGILGRIDFSIRIFETAILKSKGKTKLFGKLNSRIAIVDISPAMDLKYLAKQFVDKDGMIIDASVYQNLPSDLILFLEKNKSNKPIVIWSQQLSDSVLAPHNVILINNLTWETTVTKFMWALAQGKSIKKVKNLMHKDMAGEIIF